MLQLINGSLFTQLLYVAAKLGLADALKNGPRTSDELAERVGVDPKSLYRVMRALASLRIFHETDSGQFELAELGKYLQSDGKDSLRAAAIMMGEEWYWRPYGELLHSTQTGQTAFEKVFGTTLFDYCASHRDAYQTFNAAMAELTGPYTEAVASAYDFSRTDRVVDVGGGTGSLISAILRASPATRGVLFDVPAVAEEARRHLKEAGLEQRCEVVSGDFFEAVPDGGDAYVLKGVIHDWDDERAIVILKNCREAIRTDGKLLLVEWDIPAGSTSSAGKLTDITMLAITGGVERTIAEYEAILQASRFKLSRVVPTRDQMNIVEAVPI